jgi:hypothetical protein
MAIAKPSSNKSPIAGSDFEILGTPKRQANAVIFADAGNGKTTLATMYAPHPVAIINFDRRADYAVAKAIKAGRKIYHTRVDLPANITKMQDMEARKLGQAAVSKVIRNFELAVRASEKGDVRTICIDTGTEYSEILRVAITGKVDAVKGDYGKSKDLINREWWRLFNLAREGNAHLIVLSRAKAIWKDNEPTGRFTFRGPEVMGDAADWVGQMRVKAKKVKGGTDNKFEMEITKAGIDISQLGEVYTSEMWEPFGGPFVYACLMQYEGSDVEDWG